MSGVHITSLMSDDQLAWRCHANCIETAREGARMAGSAGEIFERDGVVLFATGSDFPVIANGAFRLDPTVPANAVIDLAEGWFAERGRGWSLGTTTWSGADQDLIDAAAARGMVTTTDMPGMVCDQRLPPAALPDGIVLRTLTTTEEAATYVAMCDLAYVSLGLPAGEISAMGGGVAPKTPPHMTTVGLFDGEELVSGAQVLFSHGIAGVYLVATAESARGRGLAGIVTRAVTNLGFDGGASCVTLQASPMGESIYRHLGYRDLYRYATHTRFA